MSFDVCLVYIDAARCYLHAWDIDLAVCCLLWVRTILASACNSETQGTFVVGKECFFRHPEPGRCERTLKKRLTLTTVNSSTRRVCIWAFRIKQWVYMHFRTRHGVFVWILETAFVDFSAFRPRLTIRTNFYVSLTLLKVWVKSNIICFVCITSGLIVQVYHLLSNQLFPLLCQCPFFFGFKSLGSFSSCSGRLCYL